MWEAKATSDDSKEISHKIGNCITFAFVAVVVALFWNKERFSLCSSCNKLSMLSLCVIMVISLTIGLGFLNSSEKVRDNYEINDMMNEIIVGKPLCVLVEEAAVEEDLPVDEVKLIFRSEAICIHGRQSSEGGSSPRVQRNTDNHTQKEMGDKCVGSSELMVVEVAADNHSANDKSELDAFNKRVENFIAKFNRQIRLEAQQSSYRYRQILPAGRCIKAV